MLSLVCKLVQIKKRECGIEMGIMILGFIFVFLAVMLIGWLRTLYVRVSPDEIAVLVGKGKRRILDTSGFRKPITEDVHKMSLEPVKVDVRTSDYIPTNDSFQSRWIQTLL